MEFRSIRSGVLVCVTLLACGSHSVGRDTAVPALSPETLEADWVRQLELRYPRTNPAVSATAVTPAEDAAGALDGVKNGEWGFHTLNEPEPWWQVDLKQPAAIGRLVLYNRGGGFAARASRIRVLLSLDGRQFHQAYQHDGTVFYGVADKKPLEIPLQDAKARFVRLQLPITTYFHLDEVEIYAMGSDRNIARNKPATQSSVSQWSSRGPQIAQSKHPAVAEIVKQGMQLAEDLRKQGVQVDDAVAQLRNIKGKLAALPTDADLEIIQPLYFQTRHAIRKLAFRNPLLDFDDVLFVKRAPTLFPHVSDQYYGWWSRPGGGVCVLKDVARPNSTVHCLTEDWHPGNFLRPDISHDGRRMLFAYCRHYPDLAAVPDKTAKHDLPEDAFYHVFEMNVDGSDVRQLTHGRYDDFDARYLPDGQIVFLSTRKGTALQAGKYSAQATTAGTCPDSYVRCGGGNHRPVAVFTLHTINGDGGDLCAVSAFENFEWTPAVASDGRIIYARWDYIDRFNGHFMSLWSTNPDGTNAQLVYGNYTKKPQCVFEARPVPGTNKLIFTATAHHSITGGSLTLLDRTRGSEFDRPLTRLTPEVCFPETEGWPDHYYAHPWPLSDKYYLASWSDRKLPSHTLMPPEDPRNPANACGIYIYDAFGNLTLLHRDPEISSVTPIPIRPRPRESVFPQLVDWQARPEGRFMVQDVYHGLDGVERGQVHSLRIIGVPPKVQPQMNKPPLSISREDTGKYVLGTAPVESDGSAYFRVPSGVPVFFQALDANGLTLQTMRSLTYVQPGQTLACVGCHEQRDTTPLPQTMSLAMLRDPSPLRPGPEGSWPLRFDRMVQPVLDRQCVACHNPKADDPIAAKLDLTAAHAYEALLQYADSDLHNLVFERDQSVVGEMPALRSKLYQLLTSPEGHYDAHLSAEDRERLATWMDTYGHKYGSFSEHQEQELLDFKQRLGDLLSER